MQINSLTTSAPGILGQAQRKAAIAAETIANLPVQGSEVGGSKDISSTDMFKPILSLKEAEQETYSGVKLLQAQKHMIGSILNIKA